MIFYQNQLVRIDGIYINIFVGIGYFIKVLIPSLKLKDIWDLEVLS